MPLYIVTKLEEILPQWAQAQFRSPRAWKTVARCWVATWLSWVLILPHRSGIELGNAGFFAVIIALIVPPSMPIQLFIFVMGTVCVGMGMGWGIGALAMRAANAARSQSLLESQFLRANQTAASSTNPDSVFASEVFSGDFLDWRSSLIYGAFIAFSAILFSTIRAYATKLALLSVFGIIVADVFCTIGPLIPTSQYTIVDTFFISTGCYVGIALLCILFIFPETMAHVHLNMTCGILAVMRIYVEGQDDILAAPPDQTSEEVAKKSGAVGRNAGIRGKMLMGLQGLMLRNALVEAEFSWGRWSGSDCKKLEEPLKLLVSRLGGLQAFPRVIAQYVSPMHPTQSTIWQSMLSSTSQVFPDPAPIPPVPPLPPVAQTENAHDMGLIAQFSSPKHARDLTLAATLPRLRIISMPLRKACSLTLGACAQVIQDVNCSRWSWSQQSSTELEKALDAAIECLRNERISFINEGRLSLAEPFVASIPSLSISSLTKALHATPPLRAFIIASTFSAQLVVVADAILLMAELVRSTCAKRRKSRLWAPRGLRALGNWLIGKSKDGDDDEFNETIGEGQRPDFEEAAQGKGDKQYKRDPDSRPPSNFFQKTMDFIYRIYKWSKSHEAIYIYKYTIVTIALWLPAVFRSSARVYYVQRGVWGLIAAQTIMNIYASDQLYNLISRLIGTVVGMVLGTVAWYIGSGNGEGNPYGLAVSVGVFLVPVIYARVFSPPTNSIPYIMGTATFALVVGYSWLDAALFTEDNPGVGWPVAWKRTVVMFIGGGASFIMMMIPPSSGRKAVRLHNSSIISELGKLYQLLMASWISEEETRYTRVRGRFASTSTIFLSLTRTQTNDDEKGGIGIKPPRYPPPIRSAAAAAEYVPQWFAQFRNRVIPIANQIRGLHLETEAAQWEGSVRGAWPVGEYQKLMYLEADILSALTQLASALSHLEPTWRTSLTRETLVLNPDFITEVISVFAMISQSLRTGEPLHQVLPSSLLDRLLYHHAHAHAYAVARLSGAGGGQGQGQERRPRHKKSKPSLSEGYRFSGQPAPDNRSRSQAPQLQPQPQSQFLSQPHRPKPKPSLISVISTAYATSADNDADADADADNDEVQVQDRDQDRDRDQDTTGGKFGSYEERIQDINFMYFASAVSAVRQIASCLDEMHEIAKDLCGEVPFEGFQEWRGEYERSFGLGRV